MSCLDKDNVRFIYLTVRITINNNVNQDNNEIKESELVILIEKKDYYDNSDDWIIDFNVSHHMTWNQDFFIVYKLKKSWVTIINKT